MVVVVSVTLVVEVVVAVLDSVEVAVAKDEGLIFSKNSRLMGQDSD